MTVIVNGTERQVNLARTIADLIRELNLVPETLLIEHNGVALHRGEWDSRPLQQADKIELLRVVAGG